MASMSLTFPRYRCVVDRFTCRNIILLTILIGVPLREAKVAANLRKSCGLKRISTNWLYVLVEQTQLNRRQWLPVRHYVYISTVVK